MSQAFEIMCVNKEERNVGPHTKPYVASSLVQLAIKSHFRLLTTLRFWVRDIALCAYVTKP